MQPPDSNPPQDESSYEPQDADSHQPQDAIAHQPHDADFDQAQDANPYAPPLTAELVRVGEPPQPNGDKPVRRPQPHFWWSLLLVLLVMGTQVVATVAAVIVIVLVIVGSTGDVQAATQMGDEFVVALVPVATGSTCLAAVAVAFLIMRRQVGRKLALRGCSAWQWLLVLLLLLPQAVIASELANLVQEVLRLIDSPLIDAFNDMSWVEAFARQPWPLVLLGACVFPALGEEIFFRGVLSRGMVAHHGVVAGSILTSVLFGLMHIAPAQALATIVIGLVLQLVFLSTRSLWAPIVLHLVNNAMAFTMVRHGESFPIPGFTVDTANHISPLLVLSALIVAVSLLSLLYQTRTRWRLPDGTEWSPGYFATEAPPAELAAIPVYRTPDLTLTAVTMVAVAAFAAAVWFSLSPA